MSEVNALTKPEAEAQPSVEHTRCGCYFRPNVDIIEKAEELVLLADVPGVDGENVNIDFEDGTLSIHAHVKKSDEEHDYLLHEYGVGDYCRNFQVSETIDSEKIVAECHDSVLVLHLPKTESAKPRKITVKSS